MKLCNFASLDPKITGTGRKGLSGASRLDRATYAQFGRDWSGLVAQAEGLWADRVKQLEDAPSALAAKQNPADRQSETYQGPSTRPALVRTFFAAPCS